MTVLQYVKRKNAFLQSGLKTFPQVAVIAINGYGSKTHFEYCRTVILCM